MKLRKPIALVLAAVMILALMAGCQKPMDAQTLAQNMSEVSETQTAMAGKMTMELEMSMSMSGTTVNIGADLEADMKYTMEPLALYEDISMTIEMLGVSQDMDMEMYMAEEDGKMVSYLYSALDDTWTRTESAEVPDVTNVVSSGDMSQIPAENLSLAEEKVTIGEAECYALTVDYSGDLFMQMLDGAMASMTAGLDEENRALLESMDLSALSTTMIYYVDPETFLPVQMEADIRGLGEVLNDLMGDMLAEAMLGATGEEMEMTFDIPTCKLSVTGITYTQVEVPTVLQEGVEAAARNPLQADGSYVLRSGEDAVRIVCPEGYTSYYTEAEALGLMDGTYTTSVDYLLDTDSVMEDMSVYVGEYVTAGQLEGNYDSHGVGEPINGFDTMYVKYTDGMISHYAWKQLDSCLLMVFVYTDNAELDLNPLLTAVEPYAG